MANLVERLEGEAGVVPLEEGVALEELAFDTLCMAAGSEGLPVAVLLVADGAGSGTGGAARMLRVALAKGANGQTRSGREFAVGVVRRDLP